MPRKLFKRFLPSNEAVRGNHGARADNAIVSDERVGADADIVPKLGGFAH